MNNKDLGVLMELLSFSPDEFKVKLVDYILSYDKRPFVGVSCSGMTPDELGYCVQLLSAYSDPVVLKEKFRVWLLKMSVELENT